MDVVHNDIGVCEEDALVRIEDEEIVNYTTFSPDFEVVRFVADLPIHTKRLFYVVCIISVLDGVQQLAFKPIQLLYLKKIGLSTETEVSFFVLLTALHEGTPIFATVLLGFCASHLGTAITLCITCLVVCLSILSLVVCHSRFAVATAFIAYGFYISANTLRQIFLTENIPIQCRTEALSIYTFVRSVGALVGPLVWLLCDRFNHEIYLGYGILLDKFTLDLFVVAGIACCMTLLSLTIHFGQKQSKKELDSIAAHRKSKPQEQRDRNRRSMWNNSSKLNVFLLFAVLDLLTSSVTSILLENVQPILLSRFQADGQHLGIAFEIVTVAELVPPVLVAIACRYLKDRDIMLVGVIIKVIGGVLYLPILGSVREWQVLIGYALNYKSAVFFETAMLSLFSAKFDPDSNSVLLGILGSSSAFGYVASQYAFGVAAVRIFGTFMFGFFLIPLFAVLLVLLWPPNWDRLIPE